MTTEIGYYRIRDMELSGRYVVERRKTEKVFGFFPVYVWIVKAFFDTRREAQDYVLSMGVKS